MAAGSGGGWFEADDLRRVVPLFSLAFLLVAAITQPSSAADLILAAVPIAAFALWAFVPAVPLAVISLAIVVPTVLVQESGHLEPVMFNVCLLAFAASRWLPSVGAAAALGALAAASPVLVALIQDPAEVAVGIWIVADRVHVGGAAALSLARNDSSSNSKAPVASWPSRRSTPSAVGSPVTCTTSSVTAWPG